MTTCTAPSSVQVPRASNVRCNIAFPQSGTYCLGADPARPALDPRPAATTTAAMRTSRSPLLRWPERDCHSPRTNGDQTLFAAQLRTCEIKRRNLDCHKIGHHL